MLLTFNLKFMKSNTAGRCHVWFWISRWLPGPDVWGKQVRGYCSLAGDAFCIWFSSRAVPMAGVSLIRQPKGSQIPLDSFVQIPDWEGLTLYVSCWQLSRHGWLIGASFSWGLAVLLALVAEGVCWGWWVVSNLCWTLGWACSALSKGGWQLSPHSGPPSCTRGSGSCPWNGVGYLCHVCPPVP